MFRIAHPAVRLVASLVSATLPAVTRPSRPAANAAFFVGLAASIVFDQRTPHAIRRRCGGNDQRLRGERRLYHAAEAVTAGD